MQGIACRLTVVPSLNLRSEGRCDRPRGRDAAALDVSSGERGRAGGEVEGIAAAAVEAGCAEDADVVRRGRLLNQSRSVEY